MLLAGVAQRAPFVLFQQSGGLVRYDDAPASLDFVAAPEGGDALPPITVARRRRGRRPAVLPAAHHVPVGRVVDAQHRGRRRAAGVDCRRPSVDPDPPDRRPGCRRPRRPPRADPAGAATICTRTPACPFHEVSLDAALASGRPVARAAGRRRPTRQVGICGPVLDLLIAEAANHPDLAVVHIEVYPNGAPSAHQPAHAARHEHLRPGLRTGPVRGRRLRRHHGPARQHLRRRRAGLVSWPPSDLGAGVEHGLSMK